MPSIAKNEMKMDKHNKYITCGKGKDGFVSSWFRPHRSKCVGPGFPWEICFCLWMVVYWERRRCKQLGQVW